MDTNDLYKFLQDAASLELAKKELAVLKKLINSKYALEIFSCLYNIVLNGNKDSNQQSGPYDPRSAFAGTLALLDGKVVAAYASPNFAIQNAPVHFKHTSTKSDQYLHIAKIIAVIKRNAAIIPDPELVDPKFTHVDVLTSKSKSKPKPKPKDDDDYDDEFD